MYRFYHTDVFVRHKKVDPSSSLIPEFKSIFRRSVNKYIEKHIAKKDECVTYRCVWYQRHQFKQWEVSVIDNEQVKRIVGYINKGKYDPNFDHDWWWAIEQLKEWAKKFDGPI